MFQFQPFYNVVEKFIHQMGIRGSNVRCTYAHYSQWCEYWASNDKGNLLDNVIDTRFHPRSRSMLQLVTLCSTSEYIRKSEILAKYQMDVNGHEIKDYINDSYAVRNFVTVNINYINFNKTYMRRLFMTNALGWQ